MTAHECKSIIQDQEARRDRQLNHSPYELVIHILDRHLLCFPTIETMSHHDIGKYMLHNTSGQYFRD